MDVNLFAQKISWRRVQTFEGHADESSQRQSGYNDEARDVVGLDRMDIHTIKDGRDPKPTPASPVALASIRRFLDAEVFFGISAKVANGVFGLISVALVGHFLSPTQQGFFFTFLSLASLWLLVDLGLNTALVQFASHECAIIDVATDETERKRAHSRLSSIARFGMSWFLVGAIAFLVLGGVGGQIFFDRVPGGAEVTRGPWPLLTIAAACDIAFLPIWSLLEGAGHVRSVYSYRTYRIVFLGLGTWGCMVSGGGLWSLPVGYLATIPLSVYWAFGRHGDFSRRYFARGGSAHVNWLKEMMPMQWRLGVVWAAGYAGSWLIVPMCLRLLGPVSAGRVGMALSLAMGVTSVGGAVVLVKSRRFGALVALRRWAELDRLALRQGLMSLALLSFGGIAVFLADVFLSHTGHPFAARLPSLPATAGLLAGTIAMNATLPMAVYLRAHKREPLVWLTIGQACLVILGVATLAPRFGEKAVALSYLVTAVLFVWPVETTIFLHLRRKWHMPNA